MPTVRFLVLYRVKKNCLKINVEYGKEMIVITISQLTCKRQERQAIDFLSREIILAS